ncbi:hypothetical protein [Hungatella hathewayi]|uniref:hypothetical protein n=1 Tax=Hungatella hathewayi TaxID=154046 RepID=UPI00356A1702
MKKWKVRINYLFGCEFIDVEVKANTERKAKIRAIEKLKKERGDKFMQVCSAKEID